MSQATEQRRKLRDAFYAAGRTLCKSDDNGVEERARLLAAIDHGKIDLIERELGLGEHGLGQPVPASPFSGLQSLSDLRGVPEDITQGVARCLEATDPTNAELHDPVTWLAWTLDLAKQDHLDLMQFAVPTKKANKKQSHELARARAFVRQVGGLTAVRGYRTALVDSILGRGYHLQKWMSESQEAGVTAAEDQRIVRRYLSNYTVWTTLVDAFIARNRWGGDVRTRMTIVVELAVAAETDRSLWKGKALKKALQRIATALHPKEPSLLTGRQLTSIVNHQIEG